MGNQPVAEPGMVSQPSGQRQDKQVVSPPLAVTPPSSTHTNIPPPPVPALAQQEVLSHGSPTASNPLQAHPVVPEQTGRKIWGVSQTPFSDRGLKAGVVEDDFHRWSMDAGVVVLPLKNMERKLDRD